jgi:hypothetical protein
MSEPSPTPDALDRANAAFWHDPDLEQAMGGTEPFRPDESFEITDLSDEEWAAFETAIREG